MAKQTFSTGQVLTAAQMTSLQQTAMGGGSATAKTASYVLVAADAGTTVAMNAAGATTITVNTALFAAGDTVFIQNLGAGSCTVTAGTATVSTAGSLILPQYDAGILYFTSASTAIFYDYIQVGAVSPLTTKGDLYTYGTSDTRLGVGANGTILTADSAEATGLKWAAAAGGGGMTLINTGGTTLTGASVTISSIPSTYKNLQLVVRSYRPASNGQSLNLRFNSDSNTRYSYIFNGQADNNSFGNNTWDIARSQNSGVSECLSVVDIFDYTNTTTWKTANIVAFSNTAANIAQFSYVVGGAVYNQTAAISSIDLFPASGNFTSGTAFLYGES